jgi:hypothetical protein
MDSFELARPLPTTMVYDYPTINKLCLYLEQQLFPDNSHEESSDGSDEMLAALNKISDEDAEALLLKELSMQEEDQTG